MRYVIFCLLTTISLLQGMTKNYAIDGDLPDGRQTMFIGQAQSPILLRDQDLVEVSLANSSVGRAYLAHSRCNDIINDERYKGTFAHRDKVVIVKDPQVCEPYTSVSCKPLHPLVRLAKSVAEKERLIENAQNDADVNTALQEIRMYDLDLLTLLLRKNGTALNLTDKTIYTLLKKLHPTHRAWQQQSNSGYIEVQLALQDRERNQVDAIEDNKPYCIHVHEITHPGSADRITVFGFRDHDDDTQCNDDCLSVIRSYAGVESIEQALSYSNCGLLYLFLKRCYVIGTDQVREKLQKGESISATSDINGFRLLANSIASKERSIVAGTYDFDDEKFRVQDLALLTQLLKRHGTGASRYLNDQIKNELLEIVQPTHLAWKGPSDSAYIEVRNALQYRKEHAIDARDDDGYYKGYCYDKTRPDGTRDTYFGLRKESDPNEANLEPAPIAPLFSDC